MRATISMLVAAVTILCAPLAHAAAIWVMKPDGTGARKVVQVKDYGGHGSPRFSHDDRRIVFDAGTEGNITYKFFVVNFDGTGLQELGANAMPDLSPDDKQIAYHQYGSPQTSVYVQNLDGQGRTLLSAGGSPRWSPDGSQIAFTDWTTVQILDLVTGEQRTIVDEPFEGYQIGFDWSPDGKQIAFVAQRNKKDELWIASTDPAKRASRVRLTHDMSTHLAFSPDGKRLALTIDGKIHLLDVEGDGQPQLIPHQTDKSGDVAWSHDGKWLAFASNRSAPDSAPQMAARKNWKLQESRPARQGQPSYSVALSSDGQRVVLGAHLRKMGFDLWNLADDSITHLDFPGVFLALSPDDRTVAATGMNIKIQLIDLDSGELRRELHPGSIPTSMAFSKDGTRLVSATLGKRAHVWDVATGKQLSVFTKHNDFVYRGAFTPDGKEVATVSQDKTVRVWDSATGTQRLELEHPEPVWGLAITPDGRQMLTGTGGSLDKQNLSVNMDRGDDNIVRLWDLASGKLLREMKGHEHAAYTIAVSPDNRWAASGGWDGTLRIWDLQSGEQIAMAKGQGSVMDVKFSSDGKQLLVGGGAIRFVGEPVRYFNNERARFFELVPAEQSN